MALLPAPLKSSLPRTLRQALPLLVRRAMLAAALGLLAYAVSRWEGEGGGVATAESSLGAGP